LISAQRTGLQSVKHDWETFGFLCFTSCTITSLSRVVGVCLQETGVYELNCVVRVDEFGFFVYWKSDGKVGVAR